MSDMMTVKEYAKYHRADPRTVRRWISNGKLECIKKKGCVRLIDSSQPRPTKRTERKTTKAKSTTVTKLNVERTANVPTQTIKEPAKIKPAVKVPVRADSAAPNLRSPINVPGQCARSFSSVSRPPAEKTADLPGNPAFENELQALGPKPIEAEPIQTESVSPQIVSNAGTSFGELLKGLWPVGVIVTLIYLFHRAMQENKSPSKQQWASSLPNMPKRDAVLSHGIKGGRPALQTFFGQPASRNRPFVHGRDVRPLIENTLGDIFSQKNRYNKRPI